MVSYSNGKYLKFRRGLTRGLIFARLKLRLFLCSMHPKTHVLQSNMKPPLLPKLPAGYPRVTRGSPATKSFMISSFKRAESDNRINEVSSRSSMNWRMGIHVSEKRFYIFKMIKLRLRGVSRTVNWDDPIISMCQCDATIEFTACKTKGHIKTFQRYFDSLSQKGFWLLFITSIKVDNLI